MGHGRMSLGLDFISTQCSAVSWVCPRWNRVKGGGDGGETQGESSKGKGIYIGGHMSGLNLRACQGS